MKESLALADAFGRSFHYLRLSLDDACNFRCLYCLPHGYRKENPDPPLSAAEIRRLVSAFAGMGFWKLRLTGGEPALRRDLVEIVASVAAVPGLRRLALSTNGHRLRELAGVLAAAGLDAVNVSVDSLLPERFLRITGHDRLAEILAGVQHCLEQNLATKLNVVLMRGINEDELPAFLELTRERPLDVRFIELMRTGENSAFFAQRHLPAGELLARLAAEGWSEVPRGQGDGPARAFSRAGHLGRAGVIAPYAEGFCGTCNRLRVTGRGHLRLCLFAESDFSLRPWLKRDDQAGDLQEAVRALLARKEASHYLPEGRTGSTRHFALMGG